MGVSINRLGLGSDFTHINLVVAPRFVYCNDGPYFIHGSLKSRQYAFSCHHTGHT